MAAEIGEKSIDEYLSLATSAERGEKNAFLERAVARHGSRDLAMDSARRFVKLIEAFVERFGNDRRICLYEAPGRVNLMGMHVDHRGGIVNPVATQERIRAVCSRREDDRIRAVSLLRSFGEGEFSISGRLPSKPLKSLGDWLNWTEGEAADHGGGKHFVNYLACGPLYLACFHYPWGQRFAGADFLLGSDLPPSAGLSSSSAIVVLATDFFLRCNRQGIEELSPHELLDVYGNGEWYIGTRGGKGDHAAIKLSRRGRVQPVITIPDVEVCEPAHFPEGYHIVLYQSGDEANKAVEPFRTGFNAPIVCYQAGEMALTDYLRDENRAALDNLLAKRAAMDAKHHRAYLGDVAQQAILSEAQVYRFLRSLPRVIARDELFAAFGEHGGGFQDGLQHTGEPTRGYRIRDVVAFGFSECARAKHARTLLASDDVGGFAAMMNRSQLGDRVTDVADDASRRIKYLEDDDLSAMERQGTPIREIAGDYHVSSKNIDRLIEIAMKVPGVLGARLTGAGMGGTVMVLGTKSFDEALDPILQRDYYEPLGREFQKIVIVPSEGAGAY